MLTEILYNGFIYWFYFSRFRSSLILEQFNLHMEYVLIYSFYAVSHLNYNYFFEILGLLIHIHNIFKAWRDTSWIQLILNDMDFTFGVSGEEFVSMKTDKLVILS